MKVCNLVFTDMCIRISTIGHIMLPTNFYEFHQSDIAISLILGLKL